MIGLFSKRKNSRKSNGFDVPPFNPETHTAVVRGSICTGERVAGFKDKKTGSFTEVMLIRSQKDLDSFKKTYGLNSVKTEY